MKCDRCKKDFSIFGELFLSSHRIRGFKNQLITIKRLACDECHKFYNSISE